MLMAAAVLTVGELIDGRYRILSQIGRGGQSLVYLAVNEHTGKKCALKQLRPDLPEPALARRSFRSELVLLKELRHPCIPAILDVIDAEERSPVIVMEYIEGRTLSVLLREQGAQPQDMVVSWCLSLCGILEYLHTRTPPVIYCDLKPGNIILRADGTVALVDFGAAIRTESGAGSGVSLGTRSFAAPEQLREGSRIDRRTDIYAFGLTLFSLLTGSLPSAYPNGPPAVRRCDPALSATLEHIIQKCIRPLPAARYSSVREIRPLLISYRSRDRMLRIRTLTLRSAGWSAFAAGVVLAIAIGLLARTHIASASESSPPAPEEQTLSPEELEFYLDLSRRIRDDTPALLKAGVEKEELEEILRYIVEQLEEQEK